jgi:NarL family two-component system sensor histidine kinase LiaS
MKKIIASYRPEFSKRFWFKLTFVYMVVTLFGVSLTLVIIDSITNYRNFNETMQPAYILSTVTEHLKPLQRLIDSGALDAKDITKAPDVFEELMMRKSSKLSNSFLNRISTVSDPSADYVVFDENDHPILQAMDNDDESSIKFLMTHRLAISGGEAFVPDNFPHSIFLNIPLSSREPASKGRIAVLLTAKYSIARQFGNNDEWITVIMEIVIITLSSVMSGYLVSKNFIQRLRHMSSISGSWSEGDFDRRIQDNYADELSAHSRHLNVMAQQLKELLGLKQQAAIQDERTRMARELHDTVKQNLFALSLQLTAINAKAPDLGETKQNLFESRNILKQAQEQLVGVISELRFTNQSAEVVMNLKSLCENLECKFNVVIHQFIQHDLMLPDNQIFVVSRIIQESIANAKRHGNAKEINISLVKSTTCFELQIKDDGLGFNRNLPTAGMGIPSMRENAATLPSGTVSIETAMGRGTSITVFWEEQLSGI